MTESRVPDTAISEVHYLRLEVNVAAALVTPDDRIVGNNMVDATLVFGWRTDDPGERSDAEVNAALAQQLSPVMAILSTALITQGWVTMGQTSKPMVQATRAVVGHTLDVPPETEAVRRCVTHHACECHMRLAEIGRRYLALTNEASDD